MANAYRARKIRISTAILNTCLLKHLISANITKAVSASMQKVRGTHISSDTPKLALFGELAGQQDWFNRKQ